MAATRTPAAEWRGAPRGRAGRSQAVSGEPHVASSSRDRLLDAAEFLFAEVGYAGISVREIAARAKVNLGSIPYYFGTKENLLKEVILRRVIPLQKARHDGLQAVLSKGKKADVADILKAVLEPAFRQSRENIVYRKLAGRLATDPTPEVRRVMNDVYNPKALVFPKALRSVCPGLNDEEFFWRIMCIYGAMFYVQADTGRMQAIAGPGFDTSDADKALRYVIPFLAAGLKAAPAKKR